jgi:F-type H+-transporting ATPase subunit epsilon
MADEKAGLHVELVAADRTVWSGEASMVIARTVEGDVGILRGHAPILSLLTEAAIEIASPDGVVHAAVEGGFISVANDRVSILSEGALLAEEIKVDEARAELDAAEGLPTTDQERDQRIRLASARIRAAERAS